MVRIVRIVRMLGVRVLGVALAALLGLAACGVSAGSGTPTGVPRTPLPVAPTAAATQTAGSTGAVTVVVDRQRYGQSDTIVVTVTNGLLRDILAPNHQTGCTIVGLEVFVNGSWKAAGGCDLGIKTALIPVRAGTTTTLQLAPGGGMLRPAPWAAGTYRAVFRYMVSNAGAEGTPPLAAINTAYSATFTVG